MLRKDHTLGRSGEGRRGMGRRGMGRSRGWGAGRRGMGRTGNTDFWAMGRAFICSEPSDHLASTARRTSAQTPSSRSTLSPSWRSPQVGRPPEALRERAQVQNRTYTYF